MEGIPVKISEQYKPPRKITLPASIRNKINSVPTFDTYDFKLERSVVERFSKLEELRQKQLDKRVKKLEILKKFEKSRNIEETANEILTPVPILKESKTEMKEAKHEGVFNLSDFENDTSSPFDNVELKTLNVMEELADVLGNSHISKAPNGYTNWQPTNYTGYTQNYTNIYPTPMYPIMMNNPHSYNSPVINKPYDLTVNTQDNSPSVENESKDKESEEEFDILKSLQKVIDDRKLQIYKSETTATSSKINPVPVPVPQLVEDHSLKLSDTERSFASNLAEMGFPFSRVAKAIQRFGLDEAKVVEYLLQVQSLLESKQYREDQIERALELNEYDEEKTRQYLENFKQIKHLGFKEDEIAAALAKTSDRDKALDILIS